MQVPDNQPEELLTSETIDYITITELFGKDKAWKN
jgi:hypothetical protein